MIFREILEYIKMGIFYGKKRFLEFIGGLFE